MFFLYVSRSMDAVRKLASDGKVAMVVDGVAYDFTNFAKDHPGGIQFVVQISSNHII